MAGGGRTLNSQLKTFGFGMRALKKFPELVPVVTFATAVCVAFVGFGAYALFTKPDVMVNRSAPERWSEIEGDQKSKFLTITQEYKKIPELEELKKEKLTGQ